MKKVTSYDLFSFIETSENRHVETLIEEIKKEFIFPHTLSHAQLKDIVESMVRAIWRLK